MTTPVVIEFDHVDKVFPGHHAVHDLSFTIREGEIVAIVGVTGCGKSTTFGLTLGLTDATSGTVRVFEHDPCAEFGWFRGRMAVVFQDPRLLPWRSVLHNVYAGMKFAGVPKQQWDSRARDWLRRLGLNGKEDVYPHTLSGGQRQRVSLARAFAVDPEIILCDESFSALDEVTSVALRKEFVDLVRDNGKTGVVITHSIAEAMTIGDRILVLRPPGHLCDDITLPADPTPQEQEELRARVLAQMTPQVGGAEA
jgi:NitT/TauT family transport system ATP-binding protein